MYPDTTIIHLSFLRIDLKRQEQDKDEVVKQKSIFRNRFHCYRSGSSSQNGFVPRRAQPPAAILKYKWISLKLVSLTGEIGVSLARNCTQPTLGRTRPEAWLSKGTKMFIQVIRIVPRVSLGKNIFESFFLYFCLLNCLNTFSLPGWQFGLIRIGQALAVRQNWF